MNFSVGRDFILRVTLFFRNNSVKTYTSSRLDGYDGTEIYVAPGHEYLNSEIFSVTLHFLVLENTMNPSWNKLLTLLKGFIFNDFYKGLLTQFVSLESIAVKLYDPTGEDILTKVISFV